MEGREPRKRIQADRPMLAAIADPMEFKKNKSSDKAREVTKINERITVNLWFDKHYIDRHQLGDDNGKRDGIDYDTVKNLVLQSVKHLLVYSACLPNFIFLNHEGIGNRERAIRIVCQQNNELGMLNVTIEAHFKSLREYEITVITAMCIDDFRVGDNQCAIEIISDDSSILKRMVNKKFVEISSI